MKINITHTTVTCLWLRSWVYSLWCVRSHVSSLSSSKTVHRYTEHARQSVFILPHVAYVNYNWLWKLIVFVIMVLLQFVSFWYVIAGVSKPETDPVVPSVGSYRAGHRLTNGRWLWFMICYRYLKKINSLQRNRNRSTSNKTKLM